MREVSIIEFFHNRIFLETLGQSRRGASGGFMLDILSSYSVAKGTALSLVLLFLKKKTTLQKKRECSWFKPCVCSWWGESKAQWHVSWWRSPWFLFSDLLLHQHQHKEFRGMFSSFVLFLFLAQEEGLCGFPLRAKIMAPTSSLPDAGLIVVHSQPKPFPSIGALLRREKCSCIDLLACFSSHSICELLGWKEGYRDAPPRGVTTWV